MKNISRTVSRFFVEVMDDWKMDSQSAVLTITDNELRIEGEQILCLPRAQIRKVQPFLNASRVKADPTSGKALEVEPDLALTVASPSGIDRLLLIRVLKNEGTRTESLFEQLRQ